MHNGFLNINAEKMSKSLGNFWYIADVRQRYEPEGIRFYMVQHHYRAPINFDVVERDGLIAFPGDRRDVEPGPVVPEAERLIPSLVAAMDDDFNTSVAVAELGEAARAA